MKTLVIYIEIAGVKVGTMINLLESSGMIIKQELCLVGKWVGNLEYLLRVNTLNFGTASYMQRILELTYNYNND